VPQHAAAADSFQSAIECELDRAMMRPNSRSAVERDRAV
jgi:hypothetical protein